MVYFQNLVIKYHAFAKCFFFPDLEGSYDVPLNYEIHLCSVCVVGSSKVSPQYGTPNFKTKMPLFFFLFHGVINLSLDKFVYRACLL